MKTVLIGCGAISRNHVNAILALRESVTLSALCDVLPEAAEKLMKEMEISVPVYTDYREMLDQIRPDAVHICTPHHCHAEMAIEALGRGIHVFLEKPACISEEELDRLEEAEKNSSATLCVCFQNRFLEGVRTVEEWIRTGKAGKILGGRGFVTWDRGGDYYALSPWRGKKATEGGSVLMNQAIHTLDLLLYFLGEPVSVRGAVGNYRNTANDTEDTAHLYMTFPNGAMGLFYATNTYCRSRRVQWELVCENVVFQSEGEALLADGQVLVQQKTGPSVGKQVWGKGHALLIRAFYEALSRGEASPVPLSSAAVSLRTVWELYRQNEESKK